MALNIDSCATLLADFIVTRGAKIMGPHETAYGAYWSPTISYWSGDRRVHLYQDWCTATKPHPFAVEIAAVGMGARRCHVTTIDEIRDIIEQFMSCGAAPEELAGHEWICDDLDSDKFIPHPPNVGNSGNIAEAVGGHIIPGSRQSVLKPWWKFWVF